MRPFGRDGPRVGRTLGTDWGYINHAMHYRFEDLSLDTGQYRLSRDGLHVPVEPQVFDLLVYLIEHRGRVVTRDELLGELWKGKVVSDSALNARLKAVRKAVGDRGDLQRIIKTVHGRGYQFVAAVQDAVEKSDAKTGITPQAAEVLPLPENPSIAVLPFANLSKDPDQDCFCDGLTEDVITELSRFRDLFVIASNSCFTYKGKAVKIQRVSEELGVQYVLEGSVQRSGDRVRISVQLIDGQTGRHLWSQRYDRGFDDVFEVQDDLTEQIVGTLATGYGGRLRKAWQKRPEAARAGNARAFDCFMCGLERIDHWTEVDMEEGRRYLERAIALDPGYTRAYSKLAWTYLCEALEGWSDDPESVLEKAYDLALQGIEMDDNESWAHWPLGAYYIYRGKFDRGIDELERAVTLNPNDADILMDYGYYLGYLGSPEQGLKEASRAMRLNPYYPEWYLSELGQIYFECRRYADAVSTCERVRRAEPLTLLYLAAGYAALGRDREAEAAVERLLYLDPKATVGRWCDPVRAPYRHPDDLTHFRDNLISAGLPRQGANRKSEQR